MLQMLKLKIFWNYGGAGLSACSPGGPWEDWNYAGKDDEGPPEIEQ